MKTVCAFCFKAIGDAEPLTDQTVISRICPDCYTKLLAENRLPEPRQLEVHDPHESPDRPHIAAGDPARDDASQSK